MMRKLVTCAVFIAALGCGYKSPTRQLAEHCIANTPAERVTYQTYEGGYNAMRFKTCQASYAIIGGDGELGLSAIIPIKEGTPDFNDPSSSISYSVSQHGKSAMFTDKGLDGEIDRLSMTDSSGNFIGMQISDSNRGEAQALLEKTRAGILGFYR